MSVQHPTPAQASQPVAVDANNVIGQLQQQIAAMSLDVAILRVRAEQAEAQLAQTAHQLAADDRGTRDSSEGTTPA